MVLGARPRHGRVASAASRETDSVVRERNSPESTQNDSTHPPPRLPDDWGCHCVFSHRLYVPVGHGCMCTGPGAKTRCLTCSALLLESLIVS